MRRTFALATLLAVAFALTGCARPPGVDGNLTNGWPAMSKAKVAVPVAGVCYPWPYDAVWHGDFDPVDCATAQHQTETAYVGTFTGADAGRSDPPADDSPALPGLYAQCQKGASDYLGGDWHTAMVFLGLVLPSDEAWAGGARWFRCDLVHLSDPDGTSVVEQGTLKGDLSGPRTAAYGCLDVTTDGQKNVLSERPIDCAKPHGAEFAGTFTAPNVPWPSSAASREKLEDNGCVEVVAKFLGYANSDQWDNPAVGWWELSFDEDQWALGDRTVQCFAYAFTKSGSFVGSVKGIRGKTPKG
ncbi:MAG TPA: septum formation family protein [Rugosimonospora sp.]